MTARGGGVGAADRKTGRTSEGRSKKARKSESLLDFYSSQADLLYSQYENINQRLGPTTHGLHPGTHCEILIRDFRRRYMVRGLSVDKGYVFGRTKKGTKYNHGPEIDILIHDAFEYPPVFRVGDFVIVRAEAVRAIIQVKRMLYTTPRRKKEISSLVKGVDQAVEAKEHLLNVLFSECEKGHSQKWKGCKNDRVRRVSGVFAGLVGFEEEPYQQPSKYHRVLMDRYTMHHQIYKHGDTITDDPGVTVLPNFVGSVVDGMCLASGMPNVPFREYGVFSSVVERGTERYKIGLQLLLAYLFHMLKWRGSPSGEPPFDLPSGLSKSVLKVPDVAEGRYGNGSRR